MRCSALAKSTAVAKRSSRRDAIPLVNTATSERGTSSRCSGVIIPRSMRPIRSSAPFDRPRISNGVWPASSVYRVAASEKTSARTSGVGSSSNISGGDHGTDMPTAALPVVPPVSPVRASSVEVCRGNSSSVVEEIPKSVSAGQPKSLVRMLAGLMSRCRMPAAWAVAIAPATRTPVLSTSATANGSRL